MEAEISDAYEKSGNLLGWRLLYSPWAVVDRAEVAFIGLNPGGTECPAGEAGIDFREGSAFVEDSWGSSPAGQSRLQIQVRSLFDKLGVPPEAVLAGNLVPFRSPDFNSLKKAGWSLQFGSSIWQRLLLNAKPSLVVVMGQRVEQVVSSFLAARLQTRVPLGWGAVCGSRWLFDDGTLVALPHLSRFGVMDRRASQEGLSALFQGNFRS